MEKLIKNYDGELIKFRVADPSEVSVLEVGYAINLEGEFISVKDGEDHSTVFSDYINAYLGEKNRNKIAETFDIPNNGIIPTTLLSLEAGKMLVTLNHVVYYGVRPADVKDIYQNGTAAGYCLLVFPDDFRESLTEEQRNAVLSLLETNHSVFGNREKVDIQFHTFSSSDSLDKEEVLSSLKSNKSYR